MRRWLARAAVILSATIALLAVCAWSLTGQPLSKNWWEWTNGTAEGFTRSVRIVFVSQTGRFQIRAGYLGWHPADDSDRRRLMGYLHLIDDRRTEFRSRIRGDDGLRAWLYKRGFSLSGDWASKSGIRSIEVDCIAPYWFVVLLASVIPAWWSWRRLKLWRRGRVGCCRNCGYDLRASKDRCPECGTPIPPAPFESAAVSP